jgi:hypothetical protein
MMPDEDTELVEFDINSVTVNEAELLEDTLGISWMEIIGEKSGTAKVMRGFVWLHKRRTDPELKLEDVNFNVVRFAQELGAPEEGEDQRPLPEASGNSSTVSTSSSTSSTASAPGKSDGSPSSNSNDGVPVSNP